MPRFYHSSDPDLSDLNRAKKSVNRDYAKQYQAQDNQHDNLGQSADVDSIYNTLTTRLIALQTALQDVYYILEVGRGSPNFFSVQQRANFQQFASRVLTEVNAVQLIMSRIKGFNDFTPPQAQGLSSLVADISALNEFIEGILSTIGGDVVGQQLADVVQTYERPIKLLLQFLTGASSNYKSVEANPKSVEARTGGAIVPAYNGEGVFGSDGYRIGDYFTYSSPRRFY
jgi:hypothetical protein